MTEWLIYLATGAFAGTLAGLRGGGGGLVIVPILVLSFAAQGIAHEVEMHLAVGTSLPTIVFTSISSVMAHHRRGAVQWHVFWSLTPGIVAGALVAGRLGRVRPPVSVSCASGDVLEVDFRLSDEGAENVSLLGPAEHVFKGVLEYGK